jgi:hypothetical protein
LKKGWHEYYIGGELAGPVGYDKENFLGLQFAAKLHEIFMLESLSIVVFTLVPCQLAPGEGVPLGSLPAALEISNIWFFCSKEFCYILVGRFSKIWKKYSSLSSYFCVLFWVLCGTCKSHCSSAGFRPLASWWDRHMVNSTAEQLFLSTLDDS